MRTIEEKNRLIAEFIGGKDQSKLIGGANEILFESPSYNGSKTSKIYTPFANLKYHTSWDWLMPVLKKISSILFSEFSSSVSNQWIMIESPTKYDIENVHEQAFQFIEWYNKQ